MPGERSATRASWRPDVTFVVPARDEAALLERALASITEQHPGGPSLETVVVDNGSSDATAAVAEAFATAHPELQVVVVREPRFGRSRAKNAGVRSARGRLIVFLDADSRASPGLAAAVARRHAGGSRAGAITVVADSADWLDRRYFELMSLGPRLFGIRAQLFYVERELFDAVGGFDERLNLAEDRDVLDRIRRTGADVCYVDEEWIATSPRRLRSLPFRFGTAAMFSRWLLANFGVGRSWPY